MLTSIDKFVDILQQPFLKNASNRRDQGFQIYRLNYLLNHIKVLQDSFPVAQIVLGENNFKFFAKQYLETYPPTVSNIERFGSSFAEFLQNRHELCEIPIIAAYSKLDWFWWRRFQNPSPIFLWQGVLQNWNAFHDGQEEIEQELNPENIVKIILTNHDDGFYLEEEYISTSAKI